MNMTREELLTWAVSTVDQNGGTLYISAPGGFSATVAGKGNVVEVELT